MDWPVRVMDVRQVIRRWEDSPAQTWPGGSLRPNDLGLFDVFGNTAEWCENFEDGKNRVTARLSWLGGEESLRPVRGGFLPRRAEHRPRRCCRPRECVLSQPPGGIPHRANVAGAVGTSRINVSSSQAVTCEDCRRTSSLIRTGARAQEAIGVGELAAKFEESS